MPTLSVTHVPQRHEADCLAACAAMALSYVGIQVRYNQLLRLLQVDTNEAGASFYHLKWLESLGAKVSIGDGHMALLETYLSHRQPVIVSVDTRELPYWNNLWQFHAVVIVGMEANNILINDPAFQKAPQQVNHIHLESAWLEREYVYATITR